MKILVTAVITNMSFKILSPLEQTHCDSMPWNKYRSKGINLQNASTFMRLQEWKPMNNFQHAFPWMTNSGEASTHLEETLQCCNLQSFLPGTSSTTDNSCIGRVSMAELYILLHWRNMSVQVHKVREDILRPTWGQSYHTYVSSSFVLDSNRGSYSIFGMV